MVRLFLKERRIFSFLLMLAIAGTSSLYSQNLVNRQSSDEEIYTARTKQFSEFTGRFNYQVDFKGNPVDSVFSSKISREKMIASLFDMKDTRSGSGKENEEYIKTKKEFISDVTLKKLMINKFSPGIIAEARARVIYNGKPSTISLFLNQEVARNGSVKWAILSAKGELFNIFIEDTTMIRFIPPASNETDFMNLKRALEDTDHLQDYAYNGFKPDYLSLFFFCNRSGIIRYEYVEEVVYHIIDLPGWYLKVKDFNRNEFNSGWLITDVARNELGMTELLKKL